MYKQRLTKPDGRAVNLYARRPFMPVSSAPAPRMEAGRDAHLRWHPLLREWVVYATHRQNRIFLSDADHDPLAVTSEPARPTELPAGDWDVAVFENMFPAFSERAAPPPEQLVVTRAARGVCEVMVFTQDASASLGALPLERVRLIVDVWADRTTELGCLPGVDYVFPFENRGAEVGGTLRHPHGQVYGFPFVPPVAARELAAQKAHWEHTGGGLLEAHLRAEVADGRRMLYEGAEAVAFVPVCARYPYEVWIAPRKPAALLPELGDAQRADLARALKIVLMKYDRLWERPMPYLLVLHQAPTDERPHPEAHVHLELYPAHHLPGRRKVAGSTELGAGVFSAEALPEDTARQLREVKAEVDEDVQPT